MALTWNDLFLSGSVIHLSTGQWLARLKIRAVDLGIEDSDAVNKAMSLGAHRLAPHEAFKDINDVIARARRAVDYHSLPFGFIFGARYVPAANLAKLTDKLRDLRTEFDTAVSAFIDQYDAVKAQALPVIEQALKDACKSEGAAAVAFERVKAEYPTADMVRAKFALRWDVYAIQGPKTKEINDAVTSEGETVKGVVAEMVGNLRGEITEKLSDVLALIQKGGSLKSFSLEAAHAVLDRVDSVNILGDEELTRQIAALRSALNGIESGKRIPDATVTGLETIKVALETSIEDAVAAAEKKLTSVGRRKLAVA